MKLIYDYTDYRSYIRDFVTFGGNQGRPISGRALSQKAGFKAPNYIGLIIDGKRNLTNAGVIALAEAMDLTPPETEFFFHLVSFAHAETKTEKVFFKRLLEGLAKTKPKRTKRAQREELTSAWYVPITLMLAVDQSPEAAQERVRAGLGFTSELAQQAIQGMLDSKMLVLQNDRLAMNSSFFLQRDPKSLKKNSEAFLRKHTQLLAESLSKTYSSESKHIVNVLGGLEVRKKEFFAILEKTTEQCAALVSDDPVEEVFVVHLHCQTLKNYLG